MYGIEEINRTMSAIALTLANGYGGVQLSTMKLF
ncbi:unnamed protein product [Nippostrongylus brasiliensis]|uniref:Transposase n=1 Tax=Nippostrongylus brasiliensis TaxID=27835 RepID=A0A0N4XSL1_NIPBR|nr:unnamed protein product [Nippostrongylus brasiliensis]